MISEPDRKHQGHPADCDKSVSTTSGSQKLGTATAEEMAADEEA